MPLALDSERFPPTGTISGSGLQRLLGAPSFDILQTVVREAVQNSVDAALPGKGARVVFRCRHLDERMLEALREGVFHSLPPKGTSGDLIRRFLAGDRPRVLEICDFGSTGLGGPSRADQLLDPDTPSDFIDFLRNVGVERGHHQSGGTYGYGKVALYRASRCSSVIVDTRSTGSGEAARRLMACHLGAAYQAPIRGKAVRFTGRHWWGVRNDPALVDPVEGSAATQLARSIGFLPRGRTDTGTSILVLDPDFGDEDHGMEFAVKRILDTLLWNYWPRMMADLPEGRRVKFQIFLDDKEVDVPDPEAIPPLNLFCDAMRTLASEKGFVRTIVHGQGQKNLGTLALVKGLRDSGEVRERREDSLRQNSSHIALMRPVDFVVKYLPCDPWPNSTLEWAGVFRASDDAEVEAAFAEAEPPAHDDWIPASISDRNRKSWVNVALRRIKEAGSEFVGSAQGESLASGSQVPLGGLAGRLGSILPGVPGEGAGPPGGDEPGTGNNKRLTRVGRPVFQKLAEDASGIVAWFTTQFSGFGPKAHFAIRLESHCSAEGGGAVDELEKAGIGNPAIVSVLAGGSVLRIDEGRVRPLTAQGELRIAVRMPDMCAVALKATLVGVEVP